MKKYLTFICEKSFPEFSIKYIATEFGLDPKDIKYLGGEVFGSAYKVGDKVIKLTLDQDEYFNALKLSGKPMTKYLINYYDARQITNRYVYILLMDYVDTLNSKEKNIYNGVLEFFNGFRREFGWILLPTEIQMNNFLKIFRTSIKTISTMLDISEEELIDKFKQIYNITKEAKKYNISTMDMHSGNIGIKDGHYVYFDIGCEYKGGYKKHAKKWDYEKLKKQPVNQ